MGALRALALGLALVALWPAAAQAGSESVTSGAVTAKLTWDGPSVNAENAWLSITRDGVRSFVAPIPHVVCDGCVLAGADDIRLVDFDGDGEREVLVVAFTGGHCCTVMGIYSFAGGTYEPLVRDWRSAGFVTDDLDHDGRPEIVTLDVRFEDLFSSHVASFPPPAVFRFLRQDGVPALADVTRGFPREIRRNAATAKRRIARLGRRDPDAGGVVSAYVADQFLLGRGRTGLRELDRLVARRVVSPAFKRRLLRRLSAYEYR